jgi:hypothetical protein
MDGKCIYTTKLYSNRVLLPCMITNKARWIWGRN